MARMSRHKNLLAAGAALAIVMTASPAQAQQRTFNMPAQSATRSIPEFGRQAGIQIIAPGGILRSIRTPALRGTYDVRAALRALLAGSGLRIVSDDGGTITLGPARASPGSGEAEAGSAAADNGSADTGATPEILVIGSRSQNADIRRTENDAQPYVIIDRDTIARSGAPNADTLIRTRINAVTNPQSLGQGLSLTGSNSSINLRGLGSDQTLVLIDGRRAVGGSISGGTPSQPDINAIPLSAIERIEVLPATASGIYGGGATGGVVNVVLRRDYTGVELTGTYGGTYNGGADSRRLDAAGGWTSSNGHIQIMFTGSYNLTDSLLNGERDFLRRARQHILTNNPNNFYNAAVPVQGGTTNILSNNVFNPQTGTVSRPNLVLDNGTPVGSTRTFVPAGYLGPAGDGGAAFVGNAGRYNFELPDNTSAGFGTHYSLLPEQEVAYGSLSLRAQLFEGLEAFVDLSASDSRSTRNQGTTTVQVTLGANDAGNPFRQAITVTTPYYGTDSLTRSKTTNYRGLVGVLADLGHNWRAGADFSISRSVFRFSAPSTLSAAATTAIRNGTINIFADTGLSGVDFGQFLNPPDQIPPTASVLKDLTLRATGPIGRLPGGRPMVTLLVERRNETTEDSYFLSSARGLESFYPHRRQRVDSVYAEVAMPVIGRGNHVPLVHAFDIQLAVRADKYRTRSADSVDNPAPDFIPDRFTNRSSSMNPTVGVRYSPVQDMAFRGSYATGFLPPAVNQISLSPPVDVSAATAVLLGLTDPKRGNEPLGDFVVRGGGDPNLRPERSTSWSFGAIITPRFLGGFRFSADWVRIDKRDNIVAFAFNQAAISNEDFVPGLVVRRAATPGDSYGVGTITEFNTGRLFNIARARVEAIDFQMGYRWNTRHLGNFDLNVSATNFIHLVTQVSPSATPVENVGVAGAAISPASTGGGLRWRGNANLTWQLGNWSASWTTRYLSSYYLNVGRTIVPNQGAASIPSQLFHDVSIAWRSPNSDTGLLANTEIRLSVNNLFNTSPRIDVVGAGGFDAFGYSRWGDPRKAYYYLSIRRGF